MTKATRETTKLNFITDQGSTRATVRCACLAERFGADPCDALAAGPAGEGLSPVLVPAGGSACLVADAAEPASGGTAEAASSPGLPAALPPAPGAGETEVVAWPSASAWAPGLLPGIFGRAARDGA